MVYNVIGLMSGSSLDGLDIVYTQLTEIRGAWSYEVLASACEPYPVELSDELRRAAGLSVPEFLRLHTRYGHYLGNAVNTFITRHQLEHKVHFICSHGHTVWHEPRRQTTTQIGDGAAIAAHTYLPVIADLRNMDVALGGEGAPIVPIADRLLFSDYNFCLNIGGIANITINREQPLAFDICPANQLLNHFALGLQKAYDENGELARLGNNVEPVLQKVNQVAFYEQRIPKSLHNGFVTEEVIPHFSDISDHRDALHTSTRHIVAQIIKAMDPYLLPGVEQKMLVTGGGAFNTFLIELLQEELARTGQSVAVVVPDEQTVKFKEAIAMALMGALRWREEPNTYASVTGAKHDSIAGTIWLAPLS